MEGASASTPPLGRKTAAGPAQAQNRGEMEIPCEMIEAAPLERPYTKEERKVMILTEARSTFKGLLNTAFAFLMAQAIQALVEAIINQIYPPEDQKGWSAVIAQAVYLFVIFLFVLLLGFVWALGEKSAKKRWEFKRACSVTPPAKVSSN